MNLTPKLNDFLYALLAAITLMISMYSYFKVVFLNDVYTFLGSSILADKLGSFPANLDIAWETRPVGNRLIFYVLYKLAEPFYGNDFLFCILTKIIVAAVILIISWYFALQVNRYLKQPHKYAVFLLTALSLFTMHLMLLLTTEFFAVVIAFLAIALLISDKKHANIISGIMMVLIILLKIVTITFIPVIILAYLLITQDITKQKIYLCIIGFLGALTAFTLMCIIWFKNFISDTLLMLVLNNPGTGISMFVRVYRLFSTGFSIWWFLPITSIGVIAGVLVFHEYTQRDSKTNLILFSFLWICPLVLVFIQSSWAAYQYAGLAISSVISIILFLSTNYQKQQIVPFTFIIFFIMCSFGLSCSTWTDIHGDTWSNQLNITNTMKTQFNLSNQPNILYLDSGISAYFIGVPVACRETYPLIIQRGYDWNLTKEPAYVNAKKCIIDYNGDYLLFDNRIDDPEITAKINHEYKKVYNGSYWGVVYPPTDLYKKIT